MSRSNPLIRLRAGVRSSSREDGLLQVGSDPRRRVLLPDTVSVRQWLHLLPDGLRARDLGEFSRVADALLAAGLLVDEDERSLLEDARATTVVEVFTPRTWRTTAVTLLQHAGLGVRDVDGPPADLVLVVADGEPDRDRLDELLATDRPVLPVSVVDARVRVGPFVVPGSSTCLRCIDAHAAESDPWFRTSAEALPLTEPDGREVTLALTQALLSATADLCAWAEGRQPNTWCATQSYDEALRVEHTRWERHPYCGCTWADDLVVPGA